MRLGADPNDDVLSADRGASLEFDDWSDIAIVESSLSVRLEEKKIDDSPRICYKLGKKNWLAPSPPCGGMSVKSGSGRCRLLT